MYTNFYKNNFFTNETYLSIKNETNDPSKAIENIAKCLQQESNEQFQRESVIKTVEKTTDYNSVDSIVNSCIKQAFRNIEDVTSQAPEADLLNNYEELEFEFILSAVKLGNIKLEDVDEFWRSNREIVKGALTYDKDLENSYSSLRFASEKLQDDKEIVLLAIQNSPFALQFASERLQDDKEVVLAAIKNSGWALQFASARLQDDEEIVLNAVKKSPAALGFASKRLREKLPNPHQVILHTLKRSADDSEFPSKKLRGENPIHEVLC